jgi:hypothetical protein
MQNSLYRKCDLRDLLDPVPIVAFNEGMDVWWTFTAFICEPTLHEQQHNIFPTES